MRYYRLYFYFLLILTGCDISSNQKPMTENDVSRKLNSSSEKENQNCEKNRNDALILHVNDVRFEFVNIPAGQFLMGSYAFGNVAEPVHKVTIDYPFQMSKTEVTVRQFSEFVQETGHVTLAEIRGKAGTTDHNLWIKHKKLKWIQKEGITWKYPGFTQGPDHPVVLISWDDANVFCDWLSEKTNSIIRLPSEAEWEYASRAGSKDDYPDNLDEVAWHSLNTDFYTHPVAQKKPNAWGLYDILGNVWEMCLDRVNLGYVGAPTDGSPWLTSNINYTGASNERVVRGGAFNRVPGTCVYACRYFSPGHSINYGFRIVREIQ